MVCVATWYWHHQTIHLLGWNIKPSLQLQFPMNYSKLRVVPPVFIPFFLEQPQSPKKKKKKGVESILL